jgi:hypothetical protein
MAGVTSEYCDERVFEMSNRRPTVLVQEMSDREMRCDEQRGIFTQRRLRCNFPLMCDVLLCTGTPAPGWIVPDFAECTYSMVYYVFGCFGPL